MPKGFPNKTEEEKQASKEKNILWRKQYELDHPYHTKSSQDKLFWAATRRAKDKGIEFTICKDDIIIPELCPYLGIPLVHHRPKGDGRRDIATLDRIDNTKGYTPDNIEVMSWLANSMKNNATPELLIKFAKEVLRRYDDHSS